MSTKESWLWLAAGLGFGAVNTGELLEKCPGGADEVAAELGGVKLDAILTQKQAERLAQSRPEDFAIRVRQAEAQNIHVLGFDDENYPSALRVINNPPPVLFVKGDVGLMNGQLSVGMVGARRPSAYGIEAMKAIGQGIALGGAIIVSGLASGLDAEAHKAALAVNGPTIACIAFGHNQCYPVANKKLMEVIARHGAVVSEYLPDTAPEKPFFLQRNRLIAGFSHGLIVVEARKHSGTMSTVNFAIDFGRDVFAVPGSIFSELSSGTNAMIREGAYLASSAADVLNVYGVQPKEVQPQPKGETLGEKMADLLTHNKAAKGVPANDEPFIETVKKAKQSLQGPQRIAPISPSTLLDERVAAVSDSVVFSKEAKAAAKPATNVVRSTKKDGTVQPYPWHKVERVAKDDIEKAKQPEKNKKQTIAPQNFGVQQPVAVQQIPVVQPVQLAMPVIKAGTQPVKPIPIAGAVQAVAPIPASEKKYSVPKADSSLAGRLSTVVKQPITQPAQKSQPPAPVKVIQSGAEQLSSTAKRALSQLGAKPVSFADICQRSGLSSAEAMAALTELELAGRSRQLAGRQFVILDISL